MNLHFVECVQGGRQPETNFKGAVKTMELVDVMKILLPRMGQTRESGSCVKY